MIRGLLEYTDPHGWEPVKADGKLKDGNTFEFHAKGKRWRFVVTSESPDRPLPSDFYVEGVHPEAGYLPHDEVSNLIAVLVMLYYARPGGSVPAADGQETVLVEFP